MKLDYNRIVKLYRYLLAVVAGSLILFLAWRDVAPRGHLGITHSFVDQSPFVSEVVPLQRTTAVDEAVRVSSEPVYFTVRYPRPFRGMDMLIHFANPDNLFLEMGPQYQAGEAYRLQALNHPALNSLAQSHDWTSVASAEAPRLRLWQKRSASYQYSGLEQWWEQAPDKERVAYYGTPWLSPYIPDFTVSKQPRSQALPVPIVGSHVFYAATDADTLAVHAEVHDMNQRVGRDDIEVELLTWSGERLAIQKIEDDGNETDDARLGSKRALDFVHTGLQGGQVYQIAIRTTDDVVLRDLTVQAPYLVVKGHISVAGGPVYAQAFGADVVGPINIISNARHFVAMTNHIASRQTIQLGQESLIISEPFEAHEYRLPDTRRFLLSQGYVLSLERGNVVLDGAGVFALTGSAYFSPTPWYFDETVDPQILELDYVIADYVPPQSTEDGALSQRLGIDITKAYAPNKSLRFQIAASDMNQDQSFDLRSLRVDLSTEPLTLGNFWEKFQRFFQREIQSSL